MNVRDLPKEERLRLARDTKAALAEILKRGVKLKRPVIGYCAIPLSKDKELEEERQKAVLTRWVQGHNKFSLRVFFIDFVSEDVHDYPNLMKACQMAADEDAPLLIATMKDFTHDKDFLFYLMNSGCEVIACDLPAIDKFSVRMMATMAEAGV